MNNLKFTQVNPNVSWFASCQIGDSEVDFFIRRMPFGGYQLRIIGFSENAASSSTLIARTRHDTLESAKSAAEVFSYE